MHLLPNHPIQALPETQGVAVNLSSSIEPGSAADIALTYELTSGYSLAPSVIAQWGVAAGGVPGKPAASFAEAVEAFVASRGFLAYDERQRQKIRLQLKQFETFFAGRRAVDICCDDFRAFIRHREAANGACFDRRTVKGLKYTLALALAAAGVPCPLVGFELPRRGQKNIEYFTVAECATMLGSLPPDERTGLALRLFVAVRPETADLVLPEHIDRRAKQIFLPEEDTKMERSEILTTIGLAADGCIDPNFWAWFDAFGYTRVGGRFYQERLKRSLGGRWITDGLRHTGATYCAARYDVPTAARLLTHSGLDVAVQRYLGLASAAQADAFYLLSPQTVPFKCERRRRRHEVPPVAELLQLRDQGLSYEAITRQFGLGRSTVSNVLCRHGIRAQ